MYPFILSLEPSKPQNVTTEAITSTEATLTWQPPAVPNGVITAYNVWYNVRLNCSGELVSYNASVGPSSREYHFTALEEYTSYMFYVSAETSAGEGMAAMAMATTMEDGMWLHLLAFARCCPGKVRTMRIGTLVDSLDLFSHKMDMTLQH